MSSTTCPLHPDRPSRLESGYGFCTECCAALTAAENAAQRQPLRGPIRPVHRRPSRVNWPAVRRIAYVTLAGFGVAVFVILTAYAYKASTLP